MTAPNFKVADHPLIQHKLTLLRRKETSTAEFRQLLGEIALLLAFEATRDLPLTKVDIETPLETMSAPVLDGKKLCLVSILRAGNGLLEGMLDLIPSARVGHIGMYRDHDTLEPVEYYLKLPHSIGERQVIVVDPMLATGNSAAAAVAWRTGSTTITGHGASGSHWLCACGALADGLAPHTMTHLLSLTVRGSKPCTDVPSI